jgi:hypothetical protein
VEGARVCSLGTDRSREERKNRAAITESDVSGEGPSSVTGLAMAARRLSHGLTRRTAGDAEK